MGRLCRKRRDCVGGTPMTLQWIASRLQAGTWKSLNNKLYLVGKQNANQSKSEKVKK
jgi:hypothetical protein